MHTFMKKLENFKTLTSLPPVTGSIATKTPVSETLKKLPTKGTQKKFASSTLRIFSADAHEHNKSYTIKLKN